MWTPGKNRGQEIVTRAFSKILDSWNHFKYYKWTSATHAQIILNHNLTAKRHITQLIGHEMIWYCVKYILICSVHTTVHNISTLTTGDPHGLILFPHVFLMQEREQTRLYLLVLLSFWLQWYQLLFPLVPGYKISILSLTSSRMFLCSASEVLCRACLNEEE